MSLCITTVCTKIFSMHSGLLWPFVVNSEGSGTRLRLESRDSPLNTFRSKRLPGCRIATTHDLTRLETMLKSSQHLAHLADPLWLPA
jgi:hypothetical protein